MSCTLGGGNQLPLGQNGCQVLLLSVSKERVSLCGRSETELDLEGRVLTPGNRPTLTCSVG